LLEEVGREVTINNEVQSRDVNGTTTALTKEDQRQQLREKYHAEDVQRGVQRPVRVEWGKEEDRGEELLQQAMEAHQLSGLQKQGG